MSYAVSNEDLAELGQRIQAASGGAVTAVTVAYGELTLEAVAHRIAHRSMVPVRRIFFCS